MMSATSRSKNSSRRSGRRSVSSRYSSSAISNDVGYRRKLTGGRRCQCASTRSGTRSGGEHHSTSRQCTRRAHHCTTQCPHTRRHQAVWHTPSPMDQRTAAKRNSRSSDGARDTFCLSLSRLIEGCHEDGGNVSDGTQGIETPRITGPQE